MTIVLPIANVDDPSRRGDVIFVHGLDGDAHLSWQIKGRPDTFWPAWLGVDLPDSGIWSLSYRAPSSGWKGTSSPLIDLASDALAALEGADIGRRPLIFVAHSLGGLLVKQMLRHAGGYGRPPWLQIHDHTRGIAFLATPHAGADLAGWLAAFLRPYRASLNVHELQAHGAALRDLNLWFRHDVVRCGIRLQVFSETLPTYGVPVVDAGSADPGIPGVVPIAVDADHSGINKLADRNALQYRLIYRFVADCLAESIGAGAAVNPPTFNATVTHDSAPMARIVPPVLPQQPTAFIGRRQELDEIVKLLRNNGVRLLTLLGPGGTGKTRLALQVAEEMTADFTGAVGFADLAPLTDPKLVAGVLGRAVGIGEQAGRAIEDLLVEHLVDRQLLIIVDNLEHLPEAASLLGKLLSGARELRLLVTSRSVLHLASEQIYPVAPLEVPDQAADLSPEALASYDAITLFVARARAVRPDFSLSSANSAAVVEICRRLDGLPLAIELAANRIRVFPPPALLSRLSTRLGLLTGGPRDVAGRQQTLRCAIEWSYDLLAPPEKILLGRLAVFVGGCSFEAAGAVCVEGLGIEVLDGLTTLVEQSLLRQIGEEEPRFVMLETIREYADERLRAAGEFEEIGRRHARYFSTLVTEAEPHLWGGEQKSWLSRLSMELDNLRAALSWALEAEEGVMAIELASELYRFWSTHGHLAEGREWTERALAVTAPITPGNRAHGLRALANLAEDEGNYARARNLLDEALALFRQTDDALGTAHILGALGILAVYERDDDRAAALLEESLALTRAADSPADIGISLLNLAGLAAHCGDQDRAMTLNEEAALLLERAGDDLSRAHALHNMAAVALACGEFPRAADLFRQSLTLRLALGDVLNIPESLEGIAQLAGVHDDVLLSGRLLGSASALRQTLHAPIRPHERESYKRALEGLSSGVDRGAWQAAWGEGSTLDWETAAQEALAHLIH